MTDVRLGAWEWKFNNACLVHLRESWQEMTCSTGRNVTRRRLERQEIVESAFTCLQTRGTGMDAEWIKAA